MSAALACARVRVLLEAYADGELAASDTALATAVRDHLAGCADCRRQHDQAVSLPFRLKALTAPEPPRHLVASVMAAVAPERAAYRRSWMLVVPEVLLTSFILWYVSGLDGLASIASGIFNDLQGLAGWSAGIGSLPDVPGVDVLLLAALIALTAIAGYHLSLFVRLEGTATTKHAVRE